MKYTFEDIEKNNLLLYRYIRGSHAYGLQLPNNQSDVDEGGVFLEPIEQVLGLGLDFQDEISDKKHDKVWYGLKKYMRLLCKSNPNILESLFVDDRFVLYQHPIMTAIKEHRQEFVTKECFKAFLGYSYDQIKKCRSLHKMFMIEETERKTPLDFCYTTQNQGSIPITEWLMVHGLEQKYCGLVSLNNMPMCYSVFYDFGAHNMEKYNGDFEKFHNDFNYYTYIQNTSTLPSKSIMMEWFQVNQTPIGYRGIVRSDGESDDVRCSSVAKGILPITVMCFNKNGFETHCRKYKEYVEWTEKRNPQRYMENKGKTFDRKNVAHAVRLLHMGIEIARTGEVRVNRKGIDDEFLLNIRTGNTDYETIIKYIEDKNEEMKDAMDNSSLPKKIDYNAVNKLLIEIRQQYQL